MADRKKLLALTSSELRAELREIADLSEQVVAAEAEATSSIEKEREAHAMLFEILASVTLAALPAIASAVHGYGVPYSPAVRLLRRRIDGFEDEEILYLSIDGHYFVIDDEGAHDKAWASLARERWPAGPITEALADELDANLAGKKKLAGRAAGVARVISAVAVLLEGVK